MSNFDTSLLTNTFSVVDGSLKIDINPKLFEPFVFKQEDNDDKKIAYLISKSGRAFEITTQQLLQNVTLSNMYDDIHGDPKDFTNFEAVERGTHDIPLSGIEDNVIEFLLFYSRFQSNYRETEEEASEKTPTARDKVIFDQIWCLDDSPLGDDMVDGDAPKDASKGTDFGKTLLFASIQAANYLDNKTFLDNMCKYVASHIRGKTPEQIRETFHVRADDAMDTSEDINCQIHSNEQ